MSLFLYIFGFSVGREFPDSYWENAEVAIMVSHSQVMDPEEIAVFHVVAVYGLGLVFYDCSHKLP